MEDEWEETVYVYDEVKDDLPAQMRCEHVCGCKTCQFLEFGARRIEELEMSLAEAIMEIHRGAK